MKRKKYIVMVSGGVDSMVLLDLLCRKQLDDYHDVTPELILVAHVNHGIRNDSNEDEVFVQRMAEQYGVDCVSVQLKLGPKASEATARARRYEWVESLHETYHAESVLTAHHQDDLLETMILQIVRGTLYRGLVPFERQGIRRPLLDWRKQDIIAYANQNSLTWREDSTNKSTDYFRNYVRHHVMPHLETKRGYFLELYQASKQTKKEIEQLSNELLEEYLVAPAILRRSSFVWLPFAVRKELIACWFRSCGLTDFDTMLIERAVLACATARPYTIVQLRAGYYFEIKKHEIEIKKVDARLV